MQARSHTVLTGCSASRLRRVQWPLGVLALVCMVLAGRATLVAHLSLVRHEIGPRGDVVHIRRAPPQAARALVAAGRGAEALPVEQDFTNVEHCQLWWVSEAAPTEAQLEVERALPACRGVADRPTASVDGPLRRVWLLAPKTSPPTA